MWKDFLSQPYFQSTSYDARSIPGRKPNLCPNSTEHYANAFVPDEGETPLQLVSAQPGSDLGEDRTKTFNFAQATGLPKGDYDAYVKPNVFPDAFADGLPPAEAAVLAATQRPLAAGACQEKSGVPAWKTIPSWCLIGTADQVIPPAEQMVMC